MSRDFQTAMLAAIEAGTLAPIIFYEGAFRNTGTLAVEYLRFWTGQGNLDWNGYTWTGAGSMLAIEGIEETSESRTTGFKVSLNGISSSILARALTADQSHYLSGAIWLGALAADGSVVADPGLARKGQLNGVSWEDAGETCTIIAEYEDENVKFLVPFNRRYTPQDQSIDHPGDTGFKQVAALQDKVIAF